MALSERFTPVLRRSDLVGAALSICFPLPPFTLAGLRAVILIVVETRVPFENNSNTAIRPRSPQPAIQPFATTMHSSRMSNDITRKSFWTQRLQAVEAAPAAPAFFDKHDTAPSGAPRTTTGPEGYARTKAVMAVDAGNLQEAASMHNLSSDTLVLAAWAVLLRSYAGEDGPVSFGVCLDREQAAWLSTMAMSGDDRLLSAMQAAEQDMKLTMGHTLSFHSLGAFAQGTGFDAIPTAVYIHSWKSRFPEMHLPVRFLLCRSIIWFEV